MDRWRLWESLPEELEEMVAEVWLSVFLQEMPVKFRCSQKCLSNTGCVRSHAVVSSVELPDTEELQIFSLLNVQTL